jgi:hypothetical protein
MNETETMSARDAYIAYRIMSRIKQIADARKDFQGTMEMYRIIGALEFHIFGYASLEWEIK